MQSRIFVFLLYNSCCYLYWDENNSDTLCVVVEKISLLANDSNGSVGFKSIINDGSSSSYGYGKFILEDAVELHNILDSYLSKTIYVVYIHKINLKRLEADELRYVLEFDITNLISIELDITSFIKDAGKKPVYIPLENYKIPMFEHELECVKDLYNKHIKKIDSAKQEKIKDVISNIEKKYLALKNMKDIDIKNQRAFYSAHTNICESIRHIINYIHNNAN